MIRFNRIFVIAILLSFVSEYISAQENVIKSNPGFEKGNAQGPGTAVNGYARFVSSASVVTSPDVIYREKRSSTDPKFGDYYLKIITPVPTIDWTFNKPWQLVVTNLQNLTNSCIDGRKYNVQFYYQNTVGHKFSAQFSSEGSNQKLAEVIIDTEAKDWTLVNLDFIMDRTKITNGRLKFSFGYNPGVTLLDNLSIVEVSE